MTLNSSSDFENAIFNTDVSVSAVFRGDANFEKAIFSGSAWFTRASFEHTARFSRAFFRGDASFGNFEHAARFENSTFGGTAWFARLTFKHIAWFHGATFKGAARFEDTTFEGIAAFAVATFESYAIFDQTTYRCQATFQAVQGESAFTMADAAFSEPPDFGQATFAQAPRLDNIRIGPRHRQGVFRAGARAFLIGNWDMGGKERWGDLLEKGRNLGARWRTLRRLARQGHDHERELLFFREELLTRRWIVDKPWHAFFWFGLFYQLLSDFGRSLSRPLVAWTALWWSFAGLYFFLRDNLATFGVVGAKQTCGLTETSEAWTAAFGLSLYRSLPVLSGLGDRLSEFQTSLYGVRDACSAFLPNTISILGMAQTVISTVLIFLFLLALRNRFRIR